MLRSLRALALAAILTLSVVGGVTPAGAATFNPGDVVVYRVGSGQGSLVNTGNPVFLDEYTPTGTLVQSVPLPTTTSGTNHRLIASGTATSEGLLTLSTDGRYLIATGYDAPIPTTGLAGTTSASVPRTVARVDATGTVDTTTALTDWASANNPRSAASDNGTNLWLGGAAGGVRSTTLGASTSTQLSADLTNIRQVNIFSNQLYESDSSGTTLRLGSVGSGTPTTAGQSITNLPGFETSTGSPYAFAFFDLSAAVAGVDTLYVAEDTAGGGQIQKWSLVSGTWVLNPTTIAATAVRGLTGSVAGSTVTLFATTGGSGATGGGSLYKVTDTSGYNAAPSTTTAATIASAGTNMAFRGVAFAPSSTQPPPDAPEVPWAAALPITAIGLVGLGIVFETRRRRRLA
jgi:hypothetical protein